MKYSILDTHVYRKIGRYVFKNLSTEEERTIFFHNWRKNETANEFEGCLSLMVAMELLAHLQDENDPAFDDCKNGIKVLARHSPTNFIPPPDIYFSKILFDFESQISVDYCLGMRDILKNVANLEPPYSEGVRYSIQEASRILEKIEQLMLSAIKQTVLAANSDNDDSNLFKEKTQENKNKKANLRTNLNNQKYLEIQANSFLKSISGINSFNLNSVADNKRIEFIKYLTENHSLPFLLTKEINEQLLQPGYIIENKTNDLTDILISFGANKNENIFLITAEKKSLRNGRGEVIEESDYFKTMRINGMN